MAMVINTNIASENAVRLLSRSQSEMSTSMERLTSGLRVNGAADDAAGKAVITGMTVQVRGTDMAMRNINDGISLVQTVDGAAEETVNMLYRIRELAIQSASETYTDVQRAQMQVEVSQLKIEIDRIADTTKFNGINVMNKVDVISIHGGWETEAANTIKISLEDFNVDALGVTGTVNNAAGALEVMNQVSTALNTISKARAGFGALQNRMDYTLANLESVNENVKSARSQIEDADFARESANLARTQVLQQAGMSMLAQANQAPQNVLALLR